MDSHELSAPPYIDNSVFPFADFQFDEASMDRPSSESAAPNTFSSNIDGRYQLNNASLFDTEYIDPALLEAPNPVAMNNFLNDYCSPAMQYTENDPSPFHPEWHSPATDFEEQQQNFQSQQGVHEGIFPNALDTLPPGGTSFDWPGASQGGQGSPATPDHLANGPTGSLAFSRREYLGGFFFRLTLIGRSENRHLERVL